MPFINTGELFNIGNTTIHIGVNTLSLLMLLIAVVAVFALVNSIRAKNILAIIFSVGAIATFGFFALATIFTFGYPTLGH
ncbi:DUF2759 family protein [Phocicoccus pinnipedialis]|uniref:DUF2759 domain-containing protein n=1 Tax=Phocicoccus pinnipedialis TaxID=110845 RepID=A0A6V7RFM4_9BACL|nr:DUF2759 family protein [Jeotgalicoccus pinnipedialis]MBP1939298.1 glucan phosphoethanolaminetransferase (alkaline phosphatase superfamily) [Jeotgalicoccus pinnipedialis]CAD2075980.1 hypothetical protein JEOPIN946_01141 [Jeotgalicoccus pinnipedialis]